MNNNRIQKLTIIFVTRFRWYFKWKLNCHQNKFLATKLENWKTELIQSTRLSRYVFIRLYTTPSDIHYFVLRKPQVTSKLHDKIRIGDFEPQIHTKRNSRTLSWCVNNGIPSLRDWFLKKKKIYTNSKPIKQMGFIAKYTQDWYQWQIHNACYTEKSMLQSTNCNTEGHKIIIPLGLLGRVEINTKMI